MSYFEEHFEALRWSVARGGRPGFRTPQSGALHAIAAHFTHRSDAALVCMPTGSGKTAVLMATPFAIGARRALVITPSRLVREQIADEVSTLRVLRTLGVIGNDVPAPSVRSVRKRITSSEDWGLLEAADVVLGIPPAMNVTRWSGPKPPPELFDLVLVDEAHHSAADTWRGVLDFFPDARRVLFSATPFRRDRRVVEGHFVYAYDLRDALRDGVFGRIEYQPIEPVGADPDAAIARAAARTLEADRSRGLNHRVMVRTGTRTRAETIAAVYAEHTSLKLEMVLGSHSLRHLRRAVDRVRTGELDGIVCVDMLGEGFDLPLLKVAALHTPHRSLAVTLQFIGRFARTTAPDLGRATFLALASDMEVEREKLYRQGAAWEEIIPALSSARVREEQQTREVLGTFEPIVARRDDGADVTDLSLHAFRPYHHVKVLRAGPDVDLSRTIDFPPGFDVIYQWYSAEHTAAVYVTRHVRRPEWSRVERFDDVRHDLFVIHHHRESGLVFICTSLRAAWLYQHLAQQLARAGSLPLRGLSERTLNQVLLDLDVPRFFHVGMKNARAANHAESYRTLAGSDVDRAIAKSDSRSYRRGHWFCSARVNGSVITLGLSSASKVWSNTSAAIPGLIAWCGELARRMMSTRVPSTLSNIDVLSTGEDAHSIPAGVVYASWNRSAFEHPRTVRYRAADGTIRHAQLLDFDLHVERADNREVIFCVSGDDCEYLASFSLADDRNRLVEPDASNAVDIVVEGPWADEPLTDYLNEHPPLFYTADFDVLDRSTLHRHTDIGSPFDPERIETRRWLEAGVDITRETGLPTEQGRSIHAFLEEELQQSDADVVLYDHGSGEIADFVTLRIANDETRVTLYHCKGSASPTPGERVEDAYEVCGQVAKSTNLTSRARLWEAIRRRVKNRAGRTRFIKGDLEMVDRALGDSRRITLAIEVVAVQPGVSRAKLTGTVGSVFAAADDFIFGGPCARLRILGSD
jgi:superfamily II DNA or RNA helicase